MNEHDLFDRIVAFMAALFAQADRDGAPVRPDVDVALFAHPTALRPFALSAGRNSAADCVMPGPYDQGWTVKWRGIHVIEDRALRADRISLHYGFAPAVHFKLDGETVLAIEPITTEHAKKCRARAAAVLAQIGPAH